LGRRPKTPGAKGSSGIATFSHRKAEEKKRIAFFVLERKKSAIKNPLCL